MTSRQAISSVNVQPPDRMTVPTAAFARPCPPRAGGQFVEIDPAEEARDRADHRQQNETERCPTPAYTPMRGVAPASGAVGRQPPADRLGQHQDHGRAHQYAPGRAVGR